ncbi:ABC transporter permease [Prosthecobacter sp.]|uniref:ABC transporter permease n=1 Tax=Prosthecobacter sp. TaxID=1965333 RepID=UPI0037836201
MPLAERTYSPEPLLGNPLRLIKAMFADIMAGRELAWRLFVRDLSAQYRQTYFGYVWAFLPPLVASLTFIFLNSQGIVEIDTGTVPYPAFAMMGTLLWQGFVDAVTGPVQSLSAAKSMLAKINFPREAILLAGFYMVLFNFAVRMVLLVGVMIWWKVPVSGGLAFFPVALGGLLLCGSAIGLAMAPIGTLYGDVSKSIPIFAQFLMLLTPVVYPARTEGLAGLLATWNPISPLMVTARQTLSGQDLTLLVPFAIITFVSLIVAFAGLVAFRLAMPHLIARMGG